MADELIDPSVQDAQGGEGDSPLEKLLKAKGVKVPPPVVDPAAAPDTGDSPLTKLLKDHNVPDPTRGDANGVMDMSTPQDRVVAKHTKEFGRAPQSVLTETDEHGKQSYVVTGRPLQGAGRIARALVEGNDVKDLERMTADPNLGHQIDTRMGMMAAREGNVTLQPKAPTFGQVAANTTLDAVAQGIPGLSQAVGGAAEQSTQREMERYANAGGKLDDWRANLLGVLGAGGEVAGVLASGRVLPGGAATRGMSGAFRPDELSGTTKIADQIYRRGAARAAQQIADGSGDAVPALRTAIAQVPSRLVATQATQAGALAAVEDIARENQVHPSRVSAVLERVTNFAKARAGNVAQALPEAAVQGATGAALAGAGSVAGGERDPVKVGEEMAKAGAQWGLLSTALGTLSNEAQYQAAYHAIYDGLNQAGIADELRTARTDMAQPADVTARGGGMSRGAPPEGPVADVAAPSEGTGGTGLATTTPRAPTTPPPEGYVETSLEVQARKLAADRGVQPTAELYQKEWGLSPEAAANLAAKLAPPAPAPAPATVGAEAAPAQAGPPRLQKPTRSPVVPDRTEFQNQLDSHIPKEIAEKSDDELVNAAHDRAEFVARANAELSAMKDRDPRRKPLQEELQKGEREGTHTLAELSRRGLFKPTGPGILEHLPPRPKKAAIDAHVEGLRTHLESVNTPEKAKTKYETATPETKAPARDTASPYTAGAPEERTDHGRQFFRENFPRRQEIDAERRALEAKVEDTSLPLKEREQARTEANARREQLNALRFHVGDLRGTLTSLEQRRQEHVKNGWNDHTNHFPTRAKQLQDAIDEAVSLGGEDEPAPHPRGFRPLPPIAQPADEKKRLTKPGQKAEPIDAWEDERTKPYMDAREKFEESVLEGETGEKLHALRAASRDELAKLTPDLRRAVTRAWREFAGDNVEDATPHQGAQGHAEGTPRQQMDREHERAKAGRSRADTEIAHAAKLNGETLEEFNRHAPPSPRRAGTTAGKKAKTLEKPEKKAKPIYIDDGTLGINLPPKERAAALGKEAFERGAPRTPALDPGLQGMFKGMQPGEALPLLDAWLHAWDKANLAAPVPDHDAEFEKLEAKAAKKSKPANGETKPKPKYKGVPLADLFDELVELQEKIDSKQAQAVEHLSYYDETNQVPYSGSTLRAGMAKQNIKAWTDRITEIEQRLTEAGYDPDDILAARFDKEHAQELAAAQRARSGDESADADTSFDFSTDNPQTEDDGNDDDESGSAPTAQGGGSPPVGGGGEAGRAGSRLARPDRSRGPVPVDAQKESGAPPLHPQGAAGNAPGSESGAVAPKLERPKGVQQTIEEEGQGASAEDVQRLMRAFYERLKGGADDAIPQGSKAIREFAATILGTPYSSGLWKMDDAYDAIEGAVNLYARAKLGSAIVGYDPPPSLAEARLLEEAIFNGRLRSSGMLALQQFSTPLPIALAAQIAAGVRAGERTLEPTAGTGNLVNLLAHRAAVDVNELSARRRAVLEELGFRPTAEDALRLPLNGKRYHSIITNPPYGAAHTGRYHGFEATPFPSTDISQRFIAAAMQELAPGGRLVAVMPPNTLSPSASGFRGWLASHFTPVAYIESPEGAYTGRGTDTGTVLMVVDNAVRPAGQEPFILRAPDWPHWMDAIARFREGGDLARTLGRGAVVDAAPVKTAPKLERPKAQADLVTSGQPAQTPTQEASDVTTRQHDAGADTPAAPRLRRPSSERGDVAAPASVRPERSAPEPGLRDAAGAVGGAGVVAPEGSGNAGAGDISRAPGLVPDLSGGRVDADAGRAGERQSEREAAGRSPVFTPYAVGVGDRRSPHPRLVVETRAMAGMPAPAITSKHRSPLVERAWGRAGAQGGISDEQMDAVERTLTAWDNGHGIIIADDVGVGKTREAAALVLEAIQRGHTRILVTTKNENNVSDAMAEFRLVASGKEGGDFPASFVNVGDYKGVKSGKESLPMPKGVTVYFAQSYNFANYADALSDVGITTWIADEAHEFKNPLSARGLAWATLHKQVLANKKAQLAYFTATPAVMLNELGYLYALREWPVGGFASWIDVKTGHGDPAKLAAALKNEQDKDAAAAAAASADVRDMGDRSEDIANLKDEAAASGKKKSKINMAANDAFTSKVTPAETEQVMRELKGAGKYLSRDLWRGGVKFDVRTVDLLGDSPEARKARAIYDDAAALARDISMASRKFGRMNQKIKTTGLERSMIQSYMKQLLFGLRLPTVLADAEAGLKAGQQVVVSLHSVAGDAELEEGMSEADANVPVNQRLQTAISRINIEHVVRNDSSPTGYDNLGDIPEALMEVSALRDRLAKLPRLVDPIRAIEDRFGADRVAIITGKRTAKQRKEAMAEFQSGKRPLAVISKAGKVGISLHDVNGKQRRMLVADYEWSADTFKQELGRVDRTGQQSSPHISLIASNLAGERKFAATIAARMASLGATSKGSAESTGTDALDQFDVADTVALMAMRETVAHLDPALGKYFTGSKFLEIRRTRDQTWEFVPKRMLDEAGMRDFLLEMMMFPVEASDRVWALWVGARDALRTDEYEEKSAARRTAATKGEVTRRTPLNKAGDPPITMVELRNEDTGRSAVLQGFVTPYLKLIQTARAGAATGMLSRRYTHVTTPTGELVSGLILNTAEARRVKDAFGRADRQTMTPAEAWEDLRAMEPVAVAGPNGAAWTLHPRRDGRMQIMGATLAKHRADLQQYAKYETVGNYLYIPGDEASVLTFLERFPPRVQGGTPPTSVAEPRAEYNPNDGPDLFGNMPAPSAADQGSLFGDTAGTEAARSLAETERAAKAELEKLKAGGQRLETPDQRHARARRIAELEKLVNRGEKIGPSELSYRAVANPADEVREEAAQYGPAAPFYSRMERAIQAGQNKATGQQWIAHLNKSVAKGEREWTGIDRWLEDRKLGTITKAEVAAQAAARRVVINRVELSEANARTVTTPLVWREERPGVWTASTAPGWTIRKDAGGRYDLSSPGLQGASVNTLEAAKEVAQSRTDNFTRRTVDAPKFASYVEPGGKNYREVLLTMPSPREPFDPSQVRIVRHERSTTQGEYDLYYRERLMWRGYTLSRVGGPSRNQPWLLTNDELVDDFRRSYEAGKTPEGEDPGSGWTSVSPGPEQRDFRSTHWDQPNVLVHFRLSDRTLPDGTKVLHVEEIQSDWHQKGRGKKDPATGKRIQAYDSPLKRERRKEILAQIDALDVEINETIRRRRLADSQYATATIAYDTLYGNDETSANDLAAAKAKYDAAKEEFEHWAFRARELTGQRVQLRAQLGGGNTGMVPDAPYKGTDEWATLALKYIIDEAVRTGADRVVWTPGQKQGARYDLSKEVDELWYNPASMVLEANRQGETVHAGKYDPRALPDVIGKDVADKLLATPLTAPVSANLVVTPADRVHHLADDELRIEATGMIEFYDKMLPKLVREYTKKIGAPVTVESVPLTGPTGPALRWSQHDYPDTSPTAGKLRQLADDAVEADLDAVAEDLRALAYSMDQTGETLDETVRGWPEASLAPGTVDLLDAQFGGAGEGAVVEPTPFPSFPITDAMRNVVLTQGQALYEQTARYQPATAPAPSLEAGEQERAYGSVENAEAQQLLSDYEFAGRAITNGLPVSASRISRIAEADRYAMLPLTGRRVRNTTDLALLLHRLRSPRIERGHWFFHAADGMILSHQMYTSNHMGMVKFAGTFVDDIATEASKLGAAYVTVAHNHPSGDPEPSAEDQQFTAYLGYQLQQRGVHLSGHLVMDHDEYAWIRLHGVEGNEATLGTEMHPFEPPADVGADWTAPIKQQASLGHLVSYAKAVLTEPNSIAALYLDSRHRVVAVEPFAWPERDPAAFLARIPERVQAHAAWQVAIGVNSMEGAQHLARLIGPEQKYHGRLNDVVDVIGLGVARGGFWSAAMHGQVGGSKRGDADATMHPDATRVFDETADYDQSAEGEEQPANRLVRSGGAKLPMPRPAGLTHERAAVRFDEIKADVQRFLNPESLDRDSRGTAGTIRHETATSYRKLQIAEAALNDLRKKVARMKRAEQVRVWTAAETGATTGDRDLDSAIALFHELTQEYTDALTSSGRLNGAAAIEHYIGRFWSIDTSPKARAWLQTIIGKRPLEGPKSFLKHRSLELFTDGLAQGLRPATYNFVDAQLAKLAEMQRLLAADRMLAYELSMGRAKRVLDTSLGKEPPVDGNGEPWVRIDPAEKDAAFIIYGPRRGAVKVPKTGEARLIDGTRVGYEIPEELHSAVDESTQVFGKRIMGHWYAPKSAQAVWAAHLSRGYAGNALYDAILWPGQAAAQLILGLSGFHATVIATEGAISDMALALDSAVNTGAPRRETLKHIGHAFVSPVRTARVGHKLLKEYRQPGTEPAFARPLEMMLAGGFRGTSESEFWAGDKGKRFVTHWRTLFEEEATRAEKAGAAVRLPFDAIFAFFEKAAWPILGYYVPRMKAGAAYALSAQAVAKMRSDADLEAYRRVVGDVMKEVDYRFGQVTYDNHFMDRRIKDIARLLFLAPGWTFGTLTLMGRGVGDLSAGPRRLVRTVRGGGGGGALPPGGQGAGAGALVPGGGEGGGAPDVPPELVGKSGAYWIAAVIVTMLLCGIITYFSTGEPPKGMDYFAFRDGTKDRDGNWNRHRIPGYLMHDVYGWTHHPVDTFLHKLSPALSFFARFVQNRTYFGDMIYDPDAPGAQRLKEVGKEVAKSVMPISASNALESKKRGETGASEVLRNALGVGPVPREMQRTPAQNLMHEYLARRGHESRTPEELEDSKLANDLKAGIRGHYIGRDSAQKLVEAGILSKGQKRRALADARKDPLSIPFLQLKPEQALRVYALAEPWEKEIWRHDVEKMRKRLKQPAPR